MISLISSAYTIVQLIVLIELVSSFNRTLTEKQVVNIVVYDKIRGYLNWYFDWFGKAALDSCNTR